MNNINQNMSQNTSQNIQQNAQNIMQQHMKSTGQQPIEIESDLVLYVFGGMLAYNFYNKYISNNIFKSDSESTCDEIPNITNTYLNFNKN
jgi:hypothetical protein